MTCGTTNKISKFAVNTGSAFYSFIKGLIMMMIPILMFLFFLYFMLMCFGDNNRPIKVI